MEFSYLVWLKSSDKLFTNFDRFRSKFGETGTAMVRHYLLQHKAFNTFASYPILPNRLHSELQSCIEKHEGDLGRMQAMIKGCPVSHQDPRWHPFLLFKLLPRITPYTLERIYKYSIVYAVVVYLNTGLSISNCHETVKVTTYWYIARSDV